MITKSEARQVISQGTGIAAAPTLAEGVYQQIRRNILEGRIAPGTRVSIRSLAESVGVSTMPTREALKRLGFEGLVEFDRRAVTITMLSPDEIRELFTIRSRLECLATEWALPAFDAEAAVALRSVLDRMAEPGIGPIVWRELNREFHQTFYACGTSRYLLELIHNIWDRIQPYMAVYASAVHDFTEADRQHAHMLQLMLAGDLDALLDATREHLHDTAEAIIRALDTGADHEDQEKNVNYEELSVSSFHGLIESGETTSAEVTAWYLQRIAELDDADNPSGPQLNSVVTVNPEAIAEARRIDERYARTGTLVGPLHGVPVLVKDQGETKGIPTSFGSTAFADYIPEVDATVVDRLRKAGAVILGKTAMCDFAAGWFSFSSRTQHTKNPYALDRETGGSSAGTAAAVTANLCLVGIGEDTGGSIRLPSSFTNLFGLRVTTGLVPRTGFSPLLHFQDTPGPMARNVADLAAILDVIVGYDPADAYTAIATTSSDVGDYVEAVSGVDVDALQHFRVGVLSDAFGSGDDQERTNGVVRAALDTLRRRGAGVVDGLVLGDLPAWVAETSLYTIQSKSDLENFLAARDHGGPSTIREIVDAGDFHELTDLLADIADGPDDPEDDPNYFKGRARQEEWRRTLIAMMAEADVDFLVYPTVQVPAPTREELAAKRWTALDFPTNTVIASQTSLPAMSIPVGFTDNGLPVGLEVLGRPLSERALLRFARAWELAESPRRAAALTSVAEA
ncbi:MULTISPECIES: amidase family protein [Gordonia]|uniref:amidase family protein n=1 Tax=Gordonia TaxID=2053 RepID=UPI001FCA3066|nr:MULTISPECIES: amidase family protein [Gordonia]MCK8615368.1 amidase family protein [Gordonia sp. C13]MDH3051753.1 amidase family protein [Gordonia alkanivorans]